MKVHGGDTATTGHLCRRQGRRRGSPSAARKCARIDHPSGRDDTIAWPCGARRVRHLRGPVPAGKRRASAVPATRIPPHEIFRRASRGRTHELSQVFRTARVSFSSYQYYIILPSFLNIMSSCSYHNTISPLPLRTLSERCAFPFPLTLRGTRIIFLLLKQSWLNLREMPRSFSRRSPNSSVVRRGR